MIVDGAQRWTSGRCTYRPAREVIDTGRYEVAAIPDDTTAKRFVLEHHYSGSYPAARFRFGLYHGSELAGVAVFSVPFQPMALACLPGEVEAKAELGRFVLLDEVAANAESWFLARCFEQLRADGLAGVVAFSDPSQRRDAAGELVFRGHVGTIYQATNATYLGKSKSRTQLVLPDGTILHRRTLAKIARRDQGWRYAAAQLERHGAVPLRPTDDARAWLTHWLGMLARPEIHRGNHKYAWTLNRRDRRHLPASLPYPKMRS